MRTPRAKAHGQAGFPEFTKAIFPLGSYKVIVTVQPPAC